MGAIFICLKNTFQRHFGKLYARISHIVVEYLRYSDTTKLPPSLNILHIQAQQIAPRACQQTVCQLPTIYTIAIKAPQFCNAQTARRMGRFIVLASPPLMFRGWVFISSASINFTFVGVYIYAGTANLPIQLLTAYYSDVNKQPLHC